MYFFSSFRGFVIIDPFLAKVHPGSANYAQESRLYSTSEGTFPQGPSRPRFPSSYRRIDLQKCRQREGHSRGQSSGNGIHCRQFQQNQHWIGSGSRVVQGTKELGELSHRGWWNRFAIWPLCSLCVSQCLASVCE